MYRLISSLHLLGNYLFNYFYNISRAFTSEPSEPSRAGHFTARCSTSEQTFPGSLASGGRGLLARVLGSLGSLVMLARPARLVANPRVHALNSIFKKHHSSTHVSHMKQCYPIR